MVAFKRNKTLLQCVCMYLKLRIYTTFHLRFFSFKSNSIRFNISLQHIKFLLDYDYVIKCAHHVRAKITFIVNDVLHQIKVKAIQLNG